MSAEHCNDCERGYYQNEFKGKACKVCQPGLYQSEKGRTICLDCTHKPTHGCTHTCRNARTHACKLAPLHARSHTGPLGKYCKGTARVSHETCPDGTTTKLPRQLSVTGCRCKAAHFAAAGAFGTKCTSCEVEFTHWEKVNRRLQR